MTHQRPVPRTLSDIFRRLKKPADPNGALMSPEALSQLKAPIRDPKQLFEGVTARPAREQERKAQALQQQIKTQGMTPPDAIFGSRAIAAPGQKLAKPYELDLEPTQPKDPIVLTSLEEVMNPEPPLVAFVEEGTAPDTDPQPEGPSA